MSKSQILTAEEYESYRIKGAFLKILERYGKTHGLTPSQINVLDWGCGRGRLVLRLRELGYNVFGVDLDPAPIQNGKDLFFQKGLQVTNLPGLDFPLRLLAERGGGGLDCGFPDGFFHCVFSGQVLEHVRDLDAVVQEIERVTCPGGIGYHNFPAQKHIVETHLFMPFIHWLPKDDLRRKAIALYLRLGLGPHWEEVQKKSLAEQAEVYYQYSLEKTFYRPAAEIQAVFQARGFRAHYDPLPNPRLDRYRSFLSLPLLRQLAAPLLTTFVLADLYVEKPLNPR